MPIDLFNPYQKIQISLSDLDSLSVSQFFIQEHALVGSENETIITKPEDYHHWGERRKESFLAGRLAVRHAQACLKLPMTDIPKGKDGSPVWPNDYTGSISHTSDRAIAVLLLNSHPSIHGIGIDIEKVSNAHQLEAPNMIGVKAEFQLLMEAGIEIESATLLLFSLKESVYKALFPMVGTFFDFLDVDLIACHEMVFTFQVKRQLSDQVQKGFQLKGRFIQEQDHLITWAYW